MLFDLEPWRHPSTADNYLPEPAGRRVVKLDEKATLEIIRVHRGRDCGDPCYILLNFEGDLRRHNRYQLYNWESAVVTAAEYHLCIYNARSKKCSRPVWRIPPADRKIVNALFEPVRLVPHQKTLDANHPQSNARLFDIQDTYVGA